MTSDIKPLSKLPLGPKFWTGVITIPFVILLLYFGGWPMFIVATAAMLVGLHEFYRGVARNGIVAVAPAGWACATGIMAATHFVAENPALRSGMITVCVAGAVLLAFMAQFWRAGHTSVIANTGATVFGVVWVGLLFSFLLRLRAVPLHHVGGIPEGGFLDRCGALVLIITTVWMQDTMAALVGKSLGTRRSFPGISPNKTWEGHIGGLLTAVIVCVGLGSSFGLQPLHMISLGIVIGVFGQLGDLAKSMIKRELGIKDFGTILPGHGGILDRFDSLLFTMPIAYMYFRLFVIPT